MPEVILKGYILVNPSDLKIIEKELQNHIKLTREEENCLIFEVT